MPRGAQRRLLLIGGGHAQVHVLEALAQRPLPGVSVTLVDPAPFATYTGMIPGLLAGLYAPSQAQIDLAALAARCGARFVADQMTSLDLAARRVALERHGTLAYDVLSLDVGARPLGSAAAARHPHVVPIKPIAPAAQRIFDFVAAQAARPATAIVVGAGAGGLEVAFALRRQLSSAASRVALVERGASLLGDAPHRLRALAARLCARARIDVTTEAGEVVASATGIRLADGRELASDLVVWSTGAEGLPVVADSGLRCDERGFALVDDTLRCVDHPQVFASGDCSRLVAAPWVPRAGVYAVRQGPVLARNLRSALAGDEALERFRPQRRFLKLLSTADRRAILSYGALASHGRAWWWLKDRIDRRFVARFAPHDV